ncbi:MAG: DUF362 domain-containing protein [Planctomycetota bacterium]|jgi:uncharacterized protein (DUF362 family)
MGLPETHQHTVAVKRCGAYDPQTVYVAICRQLELLGGADCYFQKGQRVLIKPNLIVPKGPDTPAQTHPEVIYAMARIVKEMGAYPVVGDSPAWGTTAGCLKALGIGERLRELGAEIVNLNQPVRMNIAGANVGISRLALEADVIINMPKLKAHQQLGATFAFKNMYGCMCGMAGKEKAYWHFARGGDYDAFCRMIVGIYQKLSPAVNIIDGIVAMEGQGPISGEPRDVGYLIVGADPVACERVCCDLIGFDPANLPLLAAAEKMDVGIAADEPINIVGDTFTKPACLDFKPAIQTPLRFTFPRICKSVAKQCMILLKTLFSFRKSKA